MIFFFPKIFSPSVLPKLADFAVLDTHTHKKVIGKIKCREASFKPFMTTGNMSLCQRKMAALSLGVKLMFLPIACGHVYGVLGWQQFCCWGSMRV